MTMQCEPTWSGRAPLGPRPGRAPARDRAV